MIETPHVTTSEPQHIAFIPLVVPSSEIMNVMGPGISEIYAVVIDQGIRPVGPWFTHHNRRPTETFDFKICVPVVSPVTPEDRVQPGELPARKVLRTVYHGPYEGLGTAWGEFHEWILANGYEVAEDLWEIYTVGPESETDPAKWRTELNKPLATVEG
jgi:effector-binding domain-containing protein